MHFFGIATHWITISPAMRNNPIALRIICKNSNDKSWQLPNIELRSKMMTENPVVAARVFHRLLHKFFSILVKLPIEDFSGRRIDINRLISKYQTDNIGVFGHITAAFGILEEQASGNLHYHGLLFGGWNINHLMLHIHKPEITAAMVKWIDDQITCHISKQFKK